MSQRTSTCCVVCSIPRCKGKCQVLDQGSSPLALTTASNPSQALNKKSKVSDQSNSGASGGTYSGTRSTSNTSSKPQAKSRKRGLCGASYPNQSPEHVEQKIPRINEWTENLGVLECQKESFRKPKFCCLHPDCENKVAGQKGFRDNSKLRNHGIRHSSEQPYACENCPQRFKQKKDLNRHVAEHRCKKPYRSCTQLSQFSADDSPTSPNPSNTLNLQNPPYTPPRHQSSSYLSTRIPSYNQAPQSLLHPQLENPHVNRALSHADPQSQHTPQSMFRFIRNTEAITEASPLHRHEPTGDVVRLAQGGEWELAAVQPMSNAQIWRMRLEESAQQVYDSRFLRIEGSLFNAALASLDRDIQIERDQSSISRVGPRNL